MVSWPLKRIGEALIDGQWVSLPLRESTSVTINRGISAEGTLARPGSMTVRVNDADATLSPRNAESELYGKFGQGTRFRFRVGDVPDTPAATMTDTFNRTVANGWGTADSGQTWAIWDPAGSSPPAANYSVSGGAGKFTVTALNSSRWITTDGADFDDFDATFTIATDTLPVDDSAVEGILLTVAARIDRTAITMYYVDIELLPDTGLAGNAGLRVVLSGYRADTVITPAITPVQQIPGLTYAAGVPLRVRLRCEGPEIRARVWPDGDTEPEHWHLQAYDTTYTEGGEFGFRGSVRGDLTATPVAMSFADLELRPLADAPDAVRMTGEVSGIDPYESEDGPESAYVDLDVAGALRRYDGPQKPLKSALRRHVGIYASQAYWSFEEGAQGDIHVAEVGEQSTTGPLTATGLEFAKDSTLVGSGPLPTVKAGGTLRSAPIPGENTGYWSLYLMFRIPTASFPASGEHQILSWTTGTATFTVFAETIASVPWIQLRGTATDGTDLGTVGISNTNLLAAGYPDLRDNWQQLKVYAQQSGANTTVRLAVAYPGTTGLGANLASAAINADRVRRINTTFGTGVAGMSIGHLATFGSATTDSFVSPNIYGATNNPLAWAFGAPGLRARDFMSVLACDQAVALDVYGPAATLLGPYTTDSFVSLVRAAADTDLGLLVERRDGIGLEYYSRESLYNRPVDLVLDYASGMVFAPFEPTDDDKGLANVLTVRRKNGSEATAEVTSGRRSTQAPPDGIGIKESSAETIVLADSQLPDQAGWRLHLATWDEMRVASLTLKMANPRMRGLLDAVLALREGSRIQVINTPVRYGREGFDLLVRGSREVHAEGVFDVTLNCAPYGPYVIGVVAVHEDFEDTTLEVSATNGGNASWARSQLHYNSGVWSLRSGAIGNNQTSDWICAVPDGATEMRFWYWTSSEAAGPGFAGDRLIVLVDGFQVLLAQGVTGWTQKIVPVAGASSVIFRYAKDNSSTSGEDAVHIDDVMFTGTAPVRVDTDGSELLAAATRTATSFVVATTPLDAPLWTRDPVQLPFDVRAGGEVMRASAFASWATDTFTRTVAGGWGSADTGQAWGVVGGAGASDFSVGSGYGSHLLSTVNVSRRCGLDFTYADVDVVVSVTTSATATGNSLYGGPVVRYVDGDNLYHLRIEFTTGNAINLDLRKRVSAVESSLATYATGLTHVAGTFVKARLQVRGTKLRAKVWAATATEPDWQITVTDSSVTTSAFVGCRSIAHASNTNVSPSIRYDAFEVINPQTMTVTARSVNGVVKPQTAGTAVSLARPARLAL